MTHPDSLNLQTAISWLERGNVIEADAQIERIGRAIDLAGEKDIRAKALDEPDLEKLWLDISEI